MDYLHNVIKKTQQSTIHNEKQQETIMMIGAFKINTISRHHLANIGF